MSDWSAGYMASIGYIYGYYTELNPQRIKAAFLNAGQVFPKVGTACELGFGQGLSINMHAAASTVEWYGTDFNPSQAGLAKEMEVSAGSGAKLCDDAFAEYVKRTDLPDFDYIGMHGIWSWVSDENRTVIIDFIKRKLKVGGVLYISYNTMPGWASFVPMRNILTEHARVMGVTGHGVVNRIEGALGFAGKLMGICQVSAKENPRVVERLKMNKGQNRQYLAHEYFSNDWQPMHFSEMTKWLEPAKMQFVCSAHYQDHIDGINLTAEQQAFLGEMPDQTMQQTVRDFIISQEFRKDYWIKGSRNLSMPEKVSGIRNLKVVLIVARENVSLKVMGNMGEASLQEAVYAPILDQLADFKPKYVHEIEANLSDKGIKLSRIFEAIMLLIGSANIALAQDDDVANEVRKKTDKLNHYLMSKAEGGGEINCLASPITAGGIPVGRFEQMFIQGIKFGKKTADELAEYVWSILESQGQRLVKNGTRIESKGENIEELKEKIGLFMNGRLNILKALQII